MEFRLLGPVEFVVDGRALPLGGAKQRALLAFFVLHAGEAVSTDALIDALWGERPPETAANTLQVHLSRVRKTLAATGRSPLLLRGEDGYRLAVDPEWVDRTRFERLASAGRAALRAGDAPGSLSVLEEALALWRGTPLADVPDEDFAQVERAALEEVYAGAVEDRIEAQLALGRGGELVPELERLVRRHPLHERLRAHLMLALYRSGRQADALAAYQDARRTLLEEVGLEPSPVLRDLERRILEHDPSLGPETEPPSQTGRRRIRRRWLAAAALAAGATGALVGLLGIAGTAATEEPISRNALVRVEPETGRVVEQIGLPSGPGAVAIGRESVWVAAPDRGLLWRVNPRTAEIERTFALGLAASDVAVGAGAVWAAGPLSASVARLDPENGSVTRIAIPAADDLPVCFGERVDSHEDEPVNIPELQGQYPFRGTPRVDLVVARQLVWYLCSAGALLRVDPTANTIARVEYPADRPQALAHGFGALWGAHADGVARVDDVLGVVRRTVGVVGAPNGVATGAGSVWVSTEQTPTVWRIRLSPERLDTISLPDRATRIAFGERALWVTTIGGRLLRIDAATNRVTASVTIGSPQSLAVGEGAVWVSARGGGD